MRNLLAYIIRYHFLLLFIGLEFLCFFLVIQHNPFQKSRFINFAHSVSGGINNQTIQIGKYLHLRKTNKELVAENQRLYDELSKYKNYKNLIDQHSIDTSRKDQFEIIHAKVVNNSTNKRFNYITLNKGAKDGVEKEMAVVTNFGVVGVVNHVSKNFCTVISILNPKLKISAKFKKNEYFGSLTWKGGDIKECVLNEIPHHVNIEKGDTIITSGHSAIFPENILLGFVEDYRLRDGNFYEIKINLALDMKSLSQVNIIKNIYREEQIQLEAENEIEEL